MGTFLANYEGHPFMQPMIANKALLYSLGAFVVLIFTLASEIIPDLNQLLSLVTSPNDAFRTQILTLVTADIVVSVGLSKLVGLFAVHIRGREAERRALELGLGVDTSGDSKGASRTKGFSKSSSKSSFKSSGS